MKLTGFGFAELRHRIRFIVLFGLTELALIISISGRLAHYQIINFIQDLSKVRRF